MAASCESLARSMSAGSKAGSFSTWAMRGRISLLKREGKDALTLVVCLPAPAEREAARSARKRSRSSLLLVVVAMVSTEALKPARPCSSGVSRELPPAKTISREV